MCSSCIILETQTNSVVAHCSVHGDADCEHSMKDKGSTPSSRVSKVHLYENSRLPAALSQFTM